MGEKETLSWVYQHDPPPEREQGSESHSFPGGNQIIRLPTRESLISSLSGGRPPLTGSMGNPELAAHGPCPSGWRLLPPSLICLLGTSPVMPTLPSEPLRWVAGGPRGLGQGGRKGWIREMGRDKNLSSDWEL